MAKKNLDDQLDDIEQSNRSKRLQDMTKEELLERIAFLEGLDGLVGLYYANNRKLNELAKSLNTFTLDVVDGGNSFKNYLSLQKEYKDMMATQRWLKNELTISEKDEEEEKMKALPLLEFAAINGKK